MTYAVLGLALALVASTLWGSRWRAKAAALGTDRDRWQTLAGSSAATAAASGRALVVLRSHFSDMEADLAACSDPRVVRDRLRDLFAPAPSGSVSPAPGSVPVRGAVRGI